MICFGFEALEFETTQTLYLTIFGCHSDFWQTHARSFVRVVKELDLKSIGPCPHRFEPCSDRFFCFLPLDTPPSNFNDREPLQQNQATVITWTCSVTPQNPTPKKLEEIGVPKREVSCIVYPRTCMYTTHQYAIHAQRAERTLDFATSGDFPLFNQHF